MAKKMRFSRAILIVPIVLVTCGFSLSGAAQEFSNIQTGQAAAIDTLATGQQLSVRALNGESRLAGHNISFKNFSGVAGQSSDTAYVLVAKGLIITPEVTAKPGQVIIFSPLQNQIIVQRYDAEKFIQSWPQATQQESADILADFETVAKKQKWGLFFGRYQSTGFNVAAPGSVSIELARRSIVGADVISKIRFSGETDPQKIEQRIVKTFVKALAEGDAKTVAALLDPSPFGRSDLRGGGDGARLLMARQLLASQDWARRLRGARFSRGNDGVWRVSSPTARAQIILKPVGDFAFIKSINAEV